MAQVETVVNVIILLLNGGILLYNVINFKDIETFKSELRVAAESEIKHRENVIPQKIEAASSLLSQLIDTEEAFQELTKVLETDADDPLEERASVFATQANKLRTTFKKNRIFLADPVKEQMEDLLHRLKAQWASFSVDVVRYRNSDIVDRQLEERHLTTWTEAWEEASEQLPELRREIESSCQDWLDPDYLADIDDESE